MNMLAQQKQTNISAEADGYIRVTERDEHVRMKEADKDISETERQT